jgi:hypothetical protein
MEIIEVNIQTTFQTITIARNLGTWQKNTIKHNMMHGMKNYSNKVMHQLTIKVMNKIVCNVAHGKSNDKRCIR